MRVRVQPKFLSNALTAPMRRVATKRCARALALSLAVIGAAVGLAPQHTVAQVEWTPFRDRDERAARARRAAPVEQAAPQPLPPMTGWPDSGPRNQPPQSAYNDGLPPMGGPPANGYGAGQPGGQPYGQPSPGGFGQVYPGSEAPLPYGAARNAYPEVPVIKPAIATGGSGRNGGVERMELEPLRAADGSGLPQNTWRNADMKTVESLLAPLAMPIKSPAMSDLVRRVMTSSVTPPIGGQSAAHWPAVGLEVVYRTGFIADMPKRLDPAATDPLLIAYRIRHALAVGKSADACTDSRALLARRAELPKPLIGEVHLMSGYCAAIEGNKAAAGLAATLARDEGIDAPLAIGTLEAISGSGAAGMSAPKRVSVLDYRLLEVMGPVEGAQILERAEPALLSTLAETAREPKLRVAAAELAAIAGAIGPDTLAKAYASATDAAEPLFRRAMLFKSIAAEPAPVRRLAAARTLLEETRKTPLHLTLAAAIATALEGIVPGPDTAPLGDVMIETALASGRLGIARTWAVSAPALNHWLALVDLGDQGVPHAMREANLSAVEDMARRNRLSSDALHRLATVLDATDVNVPIPLWEAASRTQQPANGFLPETGVLAQLQIAAKNKDVGITALTAARALGGPARDAQIIALGDTIRGLRRAGLDGDARRIAVEALLADWPRAGGA